MALRRALAMAVAAAATAIAASGALGVPSPDSRTHELGRVAPGERTLLVTFADRPDRAVAARRLWGLGTVRPSVPEIGLWELVASRPATARAAALRRPAVRLAEWPFREASHALTDPPPAPPPTLALQALDEPPDDIYRDAATAWSMHTGRWSFGLSAHERPTIAILDSGIATTHEEWSGGVLVWPYSTIHNSTQVEDVSPRGHGTHVAGIAAAPANGVGVVGVAPASPTPADPGVSKLMPVQIADASGFSTNATTIRGIRWAVAHGAKVINISSGGPGYVQAFQNTVDWAFRRGVLIVASVGNDGMRTNDLEYPAGYDHVIGVAAQCGPRVDPSIGCATPFARAGFSQHNASVDLLAPGVDIPSSVPLSATATPIKPGYALMSGTSMAAPYVTGAAALVFASHPGITPFQVTRLLESTASRGAAGRARTSREGWGLVDPFTAAQAPAPVDDLAEPNDDRRFLPKGLTLRPMASVSRLAAWADANDDPFDTYPVLLRRGQRLKVTITASSARMSLFVFRPSTPSTGRDLTNAQFAVKRLGQSRFTTPGTRAVVVTARDTGRHFITVMASLGGGPYTLRIRRL